MNVLLKTELLPWGIATELRVVSSSLEPVIHEICIRPVAFLDIFTKEGPKHDGRVVLAEISTNADDAEVSNPKPFSSQAEALRNGTATVRIREPKKGDIVLVRAGIYSFPEGSPTSYARTFVYTGWRWRLLGVREKFDVLSFGRKLFIGSRKLRARKKFRYDLDFRYSGVGREALALTVWNIGKTSFCIRFSEDSSRLLEPHSPPTFPIGRKEILDFVGRRICFESLLRHAEEQTRLFLDEQKKRERERVKLADEVNRLSIAGILFANRIWEARQISKSESFGEPRRKFEAALGFKRIEEGHDKGKLVEISPEETAQILGVKIEYPKT